MAEAPKYRFDPDEIYGIALRYLDSDLTDQERDALRDQLADDSESAKLFVESVQLVCMVREQARRVESLRHELSLPNDQDVIGSQVMEELLRLELAAPVVPYAFEPSTTEAETPPREDESQNRNSPTALTGYLLLHMAKSRPVKWFAAAAAVALVVTLSIWFGVSGNDDTGQATSDAHPEDTPPVLPQALVASLTAESDAVWDQQPASDIYSGQRFTLIQGNAQITTARGAVAHIHAPTTIEFFNNPNAIRLNFGKLVGVCETESSKGFLVRTPHMDVTDLGTRFGVDASSPGATEVHVIEGEVKASVASGINQTRQVQRLKAGEAIRADHSSEVLKPLPYSRNQFFDMTGVFELTGTGLNLKAGQQDPNWWLTEVDGEPIEGGPLPLKVYQYDVPHHDRLKNNPKLSQWLTCAEARELNALHEDFTLKSEQTIPRSVVQEAAQIEMLFHADNELKALLVNGQPIEWRVLDSRAGGRMCHAVIDLQPGLLRHGVNTFEAIVHDDGHSLFGLNLCCRIVKAGSELELGERLEQGGSPQIMQQAVISVA